MMSEMINGTIPDVVPLYRYGGRPGDLSWSAAFPIILHQIATYAKNMTITKQFYPNVMEYIKTTLNSVPEHDITKMPYCHYGDWVPPPPNPTKVDNMFTGAFSFLMNIKRMKVVAELL